MVNEADTAKNLRLIRLAHTVIWAFFAGCVMAIPISSFLGYFNLSLTLILIVLIEVIVLLLNSWSCPLTNMAAKYTDDRRDNFDIYLPIFIARNNKLIFGGLYIIGVIYTLTMWVVTSESA